MSETLNEWYPPSISPSSSSFGYSSMASHHTNSSSTTQITSPSSKPTKRRSRSSRRTPTTLLNANTTNFRALVQEFTGCHRSKAATTSCSNSSLIGCQKGPVNLDFQLGSVIVQNANQSLNYEAYNYNNHGGQFQTQVHHQLQPLRQLVAEQKYTNPLCSEDVNNNFGARSSEIGIDDLESVMMGDGIDLTDDIACLQQPLSDQNFDHGFLWNLHNEYPSLSHVN